MPDLKDYQKAGEDIFHKLHLPTYPVAIKYIKDKAEIPEGAMQPSAYGQKMALCQAITHSKRSGATIAMTADDNFCTPSTAGHQWVKVPLETFIESQVRQGWHKDEEAERRRVEAQAKTLAQKDISKMFGYIGFVCSPLEKAHDIPDTVLLHGDGVQLTHVIHALTYEYLHVPMSSFDGYGETCLKGGLLPFVTGVPQIVLPGAGDRSFSGSSPFEMGIGMPAELIFYTLDNLFKSGGMMNIGFPARPLMATGIDESITPGFKFMREEIDKIK